MGKFQVISHPLIQHKLSILRREDTSTKDFRELVNEIAMLMGYEVSRDLPLEEVEIQTPITKTVQKQLSGKKLAIVPILRAGIGMVDGFLSLVPAAKVGHIGMYRDEETLEPVEYLVKLPTQHLWMRNLMKTVILFQVLEMQVTVSLVQNKLKRENFPFFTRLISLK